MLSDSKISTLESGFKNLRIYLRIRRMRVDDSRIRKEKVADSKISGYVWTGPKTITWLWRWLPQRLSKRQSQTTVLLRTPFTPRWSFSGQGSLLNDSHLLKTVATKKRKISFSMIAVFFTEILCAHSDWYYKTFHSYYKIDQCFVQLHWLQFPDLFCEQMTKWRHHQKKYLLFCSKLCS